MACVKKGFSLIEVMVALAMFGIVAVTFMSLMITVSRKVFTGNERWQLAVMAHNYFIHSIKKKQLEPGTSMQSVRNGVEEKITCAVPAQDAAYAQIKNLVVEQIALESELSNIRHTAVRLVYIATPKKQQDPKAEKVPAHASNGPKKIGPAGAPQASGRLLPGVQK